MAQRPPTRQSAPAEILAQLNGGYDGYTDPTIAPFTRWSDAHNVFSGAFGYIERCRFASIVSFTPPTGLPFKSLKYYAISGTGAYLLADLAGKLFSYDTGANYAQTQRINPYVDPAGTGSSQLVGPFSREIIENIAYEMNGQVKFAGRLANAATIEGFGLDAPDATPQVQLNAGVSSTITSITRANGVVTATVTPAFFPPPSSDPTLFNVTGVTDGSFNGTFMTVTSGGTTVKWNQLGQNATSSGGTVNSSITKTIGRSYAYAWENANKAHVGAPGPATQYIQYNVQSGVVTLVEVGSISFSTGSTAVVGQATQFTSAWVGRSLWVVGFGVLGRVLSVTDATHLTLAAPSALNSAGFFFQFQVYDPQATHIRLYATADGGASYFRIARNAWLPSTTSVTLSGLTFYDNANSEPPAFPYTTETAQVNNLPPPVGRFLASYQGRIIVFGIAGAEQSFFYSNEEATTIGLPQESFAPLNQITLPIANSAIRGWIEFPGSAVIFSDKQDMFRLTGLLTDNTVTGVAQSNAAAQQGAQITRLPYALGCATPFATAITPLGGIWLTPNAEVWLFTDRYAPRNIGKSIQDILASADPSKLGLARMAYYHNNNRNWVALAYPANGSSFNNTLLVLDLDLLASNGSPSYYEFDMATNAPSWYVFDIRTDALEIVYENAGVVRLVNAAIDAINDADYHGGFGTEIAVIGATVELHAFGNDSAFTIKRPAWLRFNTNRDPSLLAAEGWSFEAVGIDDDFYTFFDPLRLPLVPSVNDTSTLGGNPDLLGGSPYRHSPELYRIGGINFMAGRRLKFRITFPTAAGAAYRLRQVQIGFSAEPPS
jgi:hypothetical protein